MRYQVICLQFCLAASSVMLLGCFSSHPKDIGAFLRPDEVLVAAGSYTLQPPDEIEIHCVKVPEVHLQKQQIRPDGNVTFENLGDVYVAGKTPAEVADLLRVKVSELYALPDGKPIDVRIATYRSKMFYVMGEVRNAGPRVCSGRDTLFTAISEAGPTVLAWEERTQVIRPSRIKGTKPKIFEVNFQRMMVHGDLSRDVLLQEGDIVYLPPTVLAAIGQVVEELVRPIGSAFSTVNVVQGPPARRAAGGLE